MLLNLCFWEVSFSHIPRLHNFFEFTICYLTSTYSFVISVLPCLWERINSAPDGRHPIRKKWSWDCGTWHKSLKIVVDFCFLSLITWTQLITSLEAKGNIGSQGKIWLLNSTWSYPGSRAFPLPQIPHLDTISSELLHGYHCPESRTTFGGQYGRKLPPCAVSIRTPWYYSTESQHLSSLVLLLKDGIFYMISDDAINQIK